MTQAADHRALIGIGEAEPWRDSAERKIATRISAQAMLTLSRSDAAADGGPIAARLHGGRGLQRGVG